MGSSPHTRGLHGPEVGGTPTERIIPAHAGFTGTSRPRCSCPGDHPRTRGVYAWAGRVSVRPPGSSPHTRGLPSGCHGILLSTRIIPAHAGFTRDVSGCLLTTWDHPRTRGVYGRSL